MDLWVARWEINRETCGQCGKPLSECRDAKKHWYPQLTVCYATREREAALARFGRLHHDKPWHDGTFTRWAEKPDKAHPYRFDMGVTVFVSGSDLGLGGDFLSPHAPKPDESDEQGGG